MSKYRNKSVYMKNNVSSNYGLNSICGIYNIGNNCYLNSGLQILASCDKLVDELDKNITSYGENIITLLKEAFDYLLFKQKYNPSNFINYFSKINNDFIFGTQCCSQNFIRTLIRNINEECIKRNFNLIKKNEQYPKSKYYEYQKFVANIYPESKVQSIFSVLTESHSQGNCPYCNQIINKYSYNFFIDQIIYLDDLKKDKYKFKDILNGNLGNVSNLIMDCPNKRCGKEIEVEEETKIIKLPEVLIFTIERYQGIHNKVKIEPDRELEMRDYIDKSLIIESTKYELFAINIRFGSTINFGHEICQVKRKGVWYEINDNSWKEIEGPSYFDSSYGLFYRVLKPSTYNRPDENLIKKDIINENKINIGNEKNKEIIAENSSVNEQENSTKIDKITQNIYYTLKGIEAIDICREVILNNIKNESMRVKIKDLLNRNYPNLNAKECSQEKIKDLIKEIKIYDPNTFSIFSINAKKYYNYTCYKCKSKRYNKYKYNDFEIYNNTEFILSLDNINYQADILELFDKNFSISFKDKCSNKHEIDKYYKIKINKFPEILTLTLNRNYKNKYVKIIPNDTLQLIDYIDIKFSKKDKTNYKLFGINILKDEKLGFEFLINIDNQWYQINNQNKYKINKNDYYKYIYGLFYKRI